MSLAYQPDPDRCVNINDTYEPSLDVPMRSPRRPKTLVSPEFSPQNCDNSQNIHTPLSALSLCYSHYTYATSSPVGPLQDPQNMSDSHVDSGVVAQKDSNSSSDRLSLFSWEADSMGVELDLAYAREPLKSAVFDEYLDEITLDDEICRVDNVVTIVKCHDELDSRKVAFVAMQ